MVEVGRRKAGAAVNGVRRVGRAREEEGEMYKSTSSSTHTPSTLTPTTMTKIISVTVKATTTMVVCLAAFPFPSQVVKAEEDNADAGYLPG